jgi:hypothetical protein
MNNICRKVAQNEQKFVNLFVRYKRNNLDFGLKVVFNDKIISHINQRMFFIDIDENLTNINL